MAKPTEDAESLFRTARTNFMTSAGKPEAGKDLKSFALSMGLEALAQGLIYLSVGLRATYIKLEEVEGLIRRQGGQGG